MITDRVRVTEQTIVEGPYPRETAHYEVAFERLCASSESARGERITLEIRVNGIQRVMVEMPGQVGRAMFDAVQNAYRKFDIEAITAKVKV